MRYHLHLALTADQLKGRDAVMTVSCDALDDAEAQEFVMDLLSDLEFDVVEIDSEDEE